MSEVEWYAKRILELEVQLAASRESEDAWKAEAEANKDALAAYEAVKQQLSEAKAKIELYNAGLPVDSPARYAFGFDPGIVNALTAILVRRAKEPE